MPVLIVEDDPSTLFVYGQQLSRAGFKVMEASSGQHALDLLERGVRPSVMVLDLRLPDVDGRDILTYMHDDGALREVPTVVVTALDADQADVRADAILFKPVPQADLVGTVRRLQQSFRRANRRRGASGPP